MSSRVGTLLRTSEYFSLYRAVVYGIILSAIISVANERTTDIAMMGRNTCLMWIPLERIASISFWDERLPITMLADARELNGMVYIRN